jgi:hypothetical protein
MERDEKEGGVVRFPLMNLPSIKGQRVEYGTSPLCD